MATTLTDVLVEMAHLLPVREEAQFSTWISIINDARPALDKLAADAAEAVPAVETVVADTENVIKGL